MSYVLNTINMNTYITIYSELIYTYSCNVLQLFKLFFLTIISISYAPLFNKLYWLDLTTPFYNDIINPALIFNNAYNVYHPSLSYDYKIFLRKKTSDAYYVCDFTNVSKINYFVYSTYSYALNDIVYGLRNHTIGMLYKLEEVLYNCNYAFNKPFIKWEFCLISDLVYTINLLDIPSLSSKALHKYSDSTICMFIGYWWEVGYYIWAISDIIQGFIKVGYKEALNCSICYNYLIDWYNNIVMLYNKHYSTTFCYNYSFIGPHDHIKRVKGYMSYMYYHPATEFLDKHYMGIPSYVNSNSKINMVYNDLFLELQGVNNLFFNNINSLQGKVFIAE